MPVQSRHDYEGIIVNTFPRIKNSLVVGLCIALLLLAVQCAVVCPPVTAHSAAQMGVSPDQYDLGIPVYWPYHAFFMTSGLLLLASGFIVMRFHKTKNWYKSHRSLQLGGSLSIIAGLLTSIYMVQISAISHMRYLHGILGAGTIALIGSTVVLGFYVYRHRGTGFPVRASHRFMGIAAIGLTVLNIALAISMMSMVLSQ